MTARIDFTRLSDVFGIPARRYDIPKLEPRRRSDEHPMAMFGVIVATAFISMVLLSSQDPAQAAVAPTAIQAAIVLAGEPVTTEKTARLPASETERVCQGQAWGAESMDCLLVIARQSGKGDVRIRLVAADQLNSSTPNVF